MTFLAVAQDRRHDSIDALAARVDAGDDAAYRDVLARARRTPPGETLEQLAEIAGRYARIAPAAFLAGQSPKGQCFGVDMLGPEVVDDPALRLRETALRMQALSRVDAPALQRMRATCLAKLAEPEPSKIEVALWVDEKTVPQGLDDDALESAGYIEHPCGIVRDVETQTLSDEGTDFAVEFDPKGDIVRRWRIPVDATPTLLSGERLMFSDVRSILEVDTNGRLNRVDPMSVEATVVPAATTWLDCPLQVRNTFQNSPSLVCGTVQEAAGGAQHRIAYQSICT